MNAFFCRIIRTYRDIFGQVHDLEFLNDGTTFLSTSTISRRSAIDKGIIAWDFDTGAQLSHQIYMESYTCPSICVHPSKNHFVAQSGGDYIAIFSAKPPSFRLDKTKRFQGHTVSSFKVQCSFSPDGADLITGSADGSIYIYDWSSSNVIKKIDARRQVPDAFADRSGDFSCLDAKFHPLIPGVIAAAVGKKLLIYK